MNSKRSTTRSTSTFDEMRAAPRAYSSSSSESSGEQSLLEEFSVSTDSGSGGIEVSSEIESLPTEEGIPLEKESSQSIYKRHMYQREQGFPLWIPQPNMTLPPSYKRRGVSIGDVGIFTLDGGFDFLFNVCLPAGDTSNPDELPEGFSPFDLKPTDVCKFRAYSSYSYLASPSVKKRGATFECCGSDGAILVMPQGAYQEDLKDLENFRKYATIHAESWYVYARGRGRQVRNGELRVVTGCDKTTSWGIATYSHLPSNRPEDNLCFLSFNPVGNEGQGRHSSHTTYEWEHGGAAEAKSGPEEDELLDLGISGSVPPRNQCTFIRYLIPALGVDTWEDVELKVASLVKDQASVRSPKSPFTSVSGLMPSSVSVLEGAQNVRIEGGTINAVSGDMTTNYYSINTTNPPYNNAHYNYSVNDYSTRQFAQTMNTGQTYGTINQQDFSGWPDIPPWLHDTYAQMQMDYDYQRRVGGQGSRPSIWHLAPSSPPAGLPYQQQPQNYGYPYQLPSATYPPRSHDDMDVDHKDEGL